MEHRGAGLEGAVLIAGPTASGKSALAVALAKRFGGMVINADSMQVYRELRILSARPSVDDEARVPHRLYGHVAGSDPYSVGRWLAEVAGVIAGAEGPVLVVGGSGLYFAALTEGLSEIPRIPEEVRGRWRALAGELGPARLHAELARRDPTGAARLRPSDPQRVTRALEVLDATGRSLLDWQASRAPPLVGAAPLRLVLDPPRPVLAARIEARARRMAEEGGFDEVRRLIALGLDPAMPVMKALGVREFRGVVEGRASPADAVTALAAATRRYAKRQATWFRNQTPGWERLTDLDPERAADRLAEAARPHLYPPGRGEASNVST